LIRIKARGGRKSQRGFATRFREGVEMLDMVGSAGMLRGWIAMWTTQSLWLLAALTVSVGAAAVAELLIAARHRRE
jgi:hypothetical protein